MFDDAEIVEVARMAAFFAMFCSVADAPRIPVELPDEVDLIRHSLHLDPVK